MADNFDKVVKALLENNKSQAETTDAVDKLNKTMADHFTFLKRQIKDEEEAKKEKGKDKRKTQALPKNLKDLNKQLGLGAIGGLSGILLPLTAGLASLNFAMEGLRGWELNAIKNLKVLDTFGDIAQKGAIAIKNNLLRLVFGIGPSGLLLEGQGKKGNLTRIMTVDEAVQRRINNIRTSFLNMFGIGADGNPIQDPKKGFKKSFTGSVMTKATDAIGTLLSPVADVSKAITGYMGGGGKALFDWIGTLAKGSAGWLSVIGKILKPIGFIFSIKAAYDDFVTSDKTSLLEKSTDAIGAFFGDFIGAPIELLKDLLSGAFKLIGWDDEAKTLDNIDLQKGITEAFQAVLDIPRELFNWVGTLFSDPAKAGKMAWDTFLAGLGLAVDTYSTLVDIMLWPVNKFFGWIGGLLNWRDPDAADMDIRATVTGWVTDFFKWFTGFLPNISKVASDLTATITNLLPEWLKKSLGLVPPDADAEAIARAAREQKLISNILTADTNADGILTKKEFYASEDGESLTSALKALDMLRGNELSSLNEILKGSGSSVIINNIDQSQNNSTSTSGGKTPMLSGDGMGATDSRYDKKYMGMRGFGVAPGQVFE